MSERALITTLRRCEINWHHHRFSPEEQVVHHVLDAEGYTSLPAPSAVRWFHATRARPGTMFDEGLLPTMAALPKLWESLGPLAGPLIGNAEWAHYRASFDTADRFFVNQFHNKRICPGWEGPFAFLVKDAALGREDGGHKDFTRICETLEDICADFKEVFGLSLQTQYENATRPCLIVFRIPGDWSGAVRAALNYVHRHANGLDCGLECNTNFSGEGQAVPASWIEEIEWL
jgi:hypothetical protein